MENIYYPNRDTIVLQGRDAIEYIINYLSNSTRNTTDPITIRYDNLAYPGMRRIV